MCVLWSQSTLYSSLSGQHQRPGQKLQGDGSIFRSRGKPLFHGGNAFNPVVHPSRWDGGDADYVVVLVYLMSSYPMTDGSALKLEKNSPLLRVFKNFKTLL